MLVAMANILVSLANFSFSVTMPFQMHVAIERDGNAIKTSEYVSGLSWSRSTR
jgi:hypothetical protein